MKLADINLNLLVNLKVLLESRNVTRAAQRLNISQSAMSKSLAQLREMFNDPLLVRVGNVLEPTPRAREIRQGLDRILLDTEALLDSPDFDPARCESVFTVAVTDYVAQFILPEAVRNIFQQAPQIVIRLLNWDRHSLREIAAGSIDLGTGSLDDPQPNLYSQKIGEDTLVCVMNPAHPLVSGGMSLEGFLAYSHAVITSGGDKSRSVDNALAARGLSRRIGLEIPYYHSALHIVAGSDMLLTLPEHIARHTCAQFGLVRAPLPFDIPRFEYSLFWHERQHHQAAHRWLRQMLMAELRRSVFTR